MIKIGKLVITTTNQMPGAPLSDEATTYLTRSDGLKFQAKGRALVWPWHLRHSERWRTDRPRTALVFAVLTGHVSC